MLPARRDKDQLTLENVHEIFERWRKNKTGRSPIPEALWKAAVSLTDCYPVNKIASYLHLNYNELKAKVFFWRFPGKKVPFICR